MSGSTEKSLLIDLESRKSALSRLERPLQLNITSMGKRMSIEKLVFSAAC
jgi:hypothetical protein